MNGSRTTAPDTVDEYLAGISPEMRAALGRLRRIIRSAAPDADEVISYAMPAVRQHGILVYYAAFADHCSLFVASPAVRRQFAAELKPYAAGKATVHFTPKRPLPADLVKRLVRARLAENEARADAKGRAPSQPPRRAAR